MKLVYHALDSETDEVAITKPILDLHGRTLVEPRIVSASDPLAFRKIKSGKPFDVDPKLEPAIAFALAIDKRFQVLRRD
jgi:hypothetical protein